MERQERSGVDWLIPAPRVKTPKREFLVPLSETAARLLEGLPMIASLHR
jgi:hypothetical protein